MASYLQLPQTPRAKTRFDEEDEADNIIDGLDAVGTKATKVAQPQQRTGPFLDPDAFRRLSASPFSEMGELANMPPGRARAPSLDDERPMTRLGGLRLSLRRFWRRNKPVLFVFFAQLFGALMNLSARLLELDGKGLNPLQLLFVRMSLTTIASCTYMYWRKVPHFPLGAKSVRWLLVARGLSGFFGIFGMWYSMMYIPLAEATVITFIVPTAAGYICHLLLHDPFTRKEQIAGFVAFAGVVLIARPTSLFSLGETTAPPSSPVDLPGNLTQPHEVLAEHATPSQRLTAIGVALLGVLGGSGAFTTIRAIGQRAHPLISVNYFSTWCTIVTTTILTTAPLLGVGQPGLSFDFPHSPWQWMLLLFICVCGFATQFLMTAGLAGERSNRATAMVYTHMLFAAGFDRWVFGHEMDTISLAGCGLIVCSALWAALSKKPEPSSALADVEVARATGTEAMPMLGLEEESDEEESISLQRIR
jgi:drug/metabolite transporter (DMT)-like permease